MMSTTLLVKNARYLITCDDQDRLLEHVNLLVEDGVITYIGEEERAADTVIDAAGAAVYPGLINTHHHLYQYFSRNLPQVQKMELFPWLKTLYPVWARLTPDGLALASKVAMAEPLHWRACLR